MWCTRWFLPLLLLPLPTAPPYFLLLFLFTLALHARPCFYCIILLAALFLSSCYWQSFPLDAQLSAPWAPDITTFYEALNATVPTSIDLHEFTPPIIRVADRCWCDFTSGIFEPYDVQKWERDSVEKVAAEMQRQHGGLIADVLDERAHDATTKDDTPAPASLPQNAPPQHSAPSGVSFSMFRWILGSRSLNSTLPAPSEVLSPSVIPSAGKTQPFSPSSPVQHMSHEDTCSLPGQLDMRPYGFDVVLDFRWSRNA